MTYRIPRWPTGKLAIIVLLASVCANAGVGAGDSETLVYQRAMKALESGNQSAFNQLRSQLQGYPLLPYLEYEDIRRNALSDFSRVDHFIDRYHDTPLAGRLQAAHLRSLAKAKRWSAYRKRYDAALDDNTELRCHYLHAQLVGNKDVFDEMLEIYPSGKSLPDACDPVFDHYYKNKRLSGEHVWNRFVIAAKRRNSTLARYLSKKLPRSQQAWFTWWQNLNARPRATLQKLVDTKSSPHLRDMLVLGIILYAREDTPAAWDFWHARVRHAHKFSREQINEVERSIALRAAWRHLDEAYGYLTSLSEAALNDEAREWRVRSALRIHNWSGAIAQIKAMPEPMQKRLQWRYWLARAYEENGQAGEAQSIYVSLAQETDYYGFMSAEKIGQDYTFSNIPVLSKEEEARVDELAARPAFQRAYLLEQIDERTDANREWNFAIAKLKDDELRVASRLAQRWGWHFNAILTIAKARHFEDLKLRFPVLHATLVESESARYGIDSSWVYGVIRRESAWREDVVSPAGALGLMQLMPSTARSMARKVGLGRPNRTQIKDVSKNIKLGTAYLREVMDKYHNNEILATASYNAGPHRVKAWLPEQFALPADVWIDTIPFDETRAYVKAVQAYSVIMDYQRGRSPRTLKSRMWPVYTLEEWEKSSSG